MSKRILLVEETVDDRTVFSSYLEFVGAEVLVAEDAEETVAIAAEHRPELILIGMGGTGVDGWAVMRRLQINPATSSIPVVALMETDVSSERLDAAGFCGYLWKPIAPFQLLEEVERCIGSIGEPRHSSIEAFEGK